MLLDVAVSVDAEPGRRPVEEVREVEREVFRPLHRLQRAQLAQREAQRSDEAAGGGQREPEGMAAIHRERQPAEEERAEHEAGVRHAALRLEPRPTCDQ